MVRVWGKMKRLLYLLFLLFTAVIAFQMVFVAEQAEAAKKVSLTEEQVKQLQNDVNFLTRKTYASSLFDPKDVQKLLEVRDLLNSVADGNMKDLTYAKMFSDMAYVLSKRDYKQDAIQYYMLVKDKFPNTIYSKKALIELENLGVKFEDEVEVEE